MRKGHEALEARVCLQAVVVAEQWGACGAGLACTAQPMRYRRVWCADAAARLVVVCSSC